LHSDACTHHMPALLGTKASATLEHACHQREFDWTMLVTCAYCM